MVADTSGMYDGIVDEEVIFLIKQSNICQAQLPDQYVILCIMLASDQTLITGNMRDKAWPIYLKLGKWSRIRRFYLCKPSNSHDKDRQYT